MQHSHQAPRLLSEEEIYLLSQTPLFQLLGREALLEVGAGSDLVTALAGTLVAQAGEPVEMLHLIKDGLVRVPLQSADGTQTTMLASPEMFGWSGLVSPYQQSTTMFAATDCTFIAIRTSHVLMMLARRDRVSALIAAQLATMAIDRLHKIRAVLDGRSPLQGESPS